MRTFAAIAIAALFSMVAVAPGIADQTAKEAEKPTPEVDKTAPQFTLSDVSGTEYTLGGLKGKYVVLEWTNMDCPFVRKQYDSGNLQDLQKRYAKEGVVWLRICSSSPGAQGNFESAVIKERLKVEKSMATAYLIDAAGDVGRLYGAKTTPHMFVINPEGVIIYAGAIDDKPSKDKADIKGATNYVSACLDASLKGEKVAVKSSVPYGCAVKYAEKADEKPATTSGS
jgi:peroxiredoxin